MQRSQHQPHRFVQRDERATAFMLIVLATFTARRMTFANPLLGFDEQFYLLVGDRLAHGLIPYVDVFDHKPIGLFLIYAAIRLLGGAGFVEYKLVAAATVAASAWLLFHLARRRASFIASLLSAIAYILWLNFMEGEGGQSPVFFTLPMIAAAQLIVSADQVSLRRGAIVMLLWGLAFQIKSSVLVEGAFFGGYMLWLAIAQGVTARGITLRVSCWTITAFAPTCAAIAYYAAKGDFAAFIFANYVSLAGQHRRPFGAEMSGLATIVAILAPLLVWSLGVTRTWRVRGAIGADGRFYRWWFRAAAASMLLYGRFDSPHYAIPLVPPPSSSSVLAVPTSHPSGGRRPRSVF